MRLLMIEDDARYCALIRHHLTCRWPDAELIVSSPVLHPIPAPEYVAQGFDAVLVSHDWPGGRGIDWVKDFASRPRFAPVIFLSEHDDDAEARQALEFGAHAALGKTKIDHARLLAAFASAAGKQMQVRADWRTSDEAQTVAALRRGVHPRLSAHPAPRWRARFGAVSRRERAGGRAGGAESGARPAGAERAGFVVPALPAGIRDRAANSSPGRGAAVRPGRER